VFEQSLLRHTGESRYPAAGYELWALDTGFRRYDGGLSQNITATGLGLLKKL